MRATSQVMIGATTAVLAFAMTAPPVAAEHGLTATWSSTDPACIISYAGVYTDGFGDEQIWAFEGVARGACGLETTVPLCIATGSVEIGFRCGNVYLGGNGAYIPFFTPPFVYQHAVTVTVGSSAQPATLTVVG
jgi:hypothetical protein